MILSPEKRRRAENGLSLVLFSLITGAAVGVVVTLYNVLVNYGDEYSVALYGEIFLRPYFIPLLLVGLLLASIVVGTAVRFVPMARGSGIPQTEGAARGLLRLDWLRTMCTMFACSLAAVFLGMSAGAEGPSVLMGGALGESTGRLCRRTREDERVLVASGASAGLAVAFNAPLTGLLFSVEEANKKATPALLVSALCSVVSALAVRGGLRALISLADPGVIPFAPAFSAYDLTALDDFPDVMAALGIGLLTAAVAALLGTAFYHAVLGARTLFGRIDILHGAGRMAVPFLLAGALGMITPFAMTGGHGLMEALGTQGGQTEMGVSLRVASPLMVAVAVILLLKFLATVCNMGAGVPCGAFVPMLAIGASGGALLALAFAYAGLPAEWSDIVVMMFVAAFFTAVVKAPVTGTVMVFELTGSYNFALLLPVAAAVTTAYLISVLLRTRPIYDVLLTGFVPAKI